MNHIQQENDNKKGAVKYIFILLLQRIIGIGLFFITAGEFYDIRGIVNISFYLIISIIACIIMLLGHQETLNERGKRQDNTKNWDKVLLPVYVLLGYYGIYIVAGFGNRLHWNVLPIECFYVGIGIYLFSCIFIVWPVIENKHFEATSRIQENREQTIIKTGPYKIVRHPGYAGIVLWAIASYLMFGTLPVGIICFIVIVIIWIRTYLEDKMLKNELAGYLEYSQTVKYRLLPLIW